MADEFDPADVLFDDVGLSFDPTAVLAAYRADAAGLERAVADTPEDEMGNLREVAAAAKAELSLKRSQVQAARRAMDEARARVA